MSEKKSDFKPKGGPKRAFGGKKPGGGFKKKFGSDGGDRRPPRRDFDGDRPPPRRDDRDGERGGFKKRSFGDRAGGEGRAFKPREGDRDGGFKKRPYGDRPPRRDDDRGGDRGGYKKRSFGDRDRSEGRAFKPRGEGRDDGFKKRPYGGPPRRDDRDGERGGYKKRSFGDRDRGSEGREFKPRGEGRPFDPDRKPRFNDRGDRDRKPYAGDRDSKPRFNDRADRGDRDRDDRPRKSFRKPERSYTRYEDRGGEERGAASFETRQKLKSDRASFGTPSAAFLYGAHAVTEALLNPLRAHQRLLCTQNGYAGIEEACRKAAEAGLTLPAVTWVEKEDIERLLPRDAVHQGVLLDAQPLEDVFLADIVISAGENAKVVVLDQVTDPHNVGAILRSAAAFGVSAVVVQKQHAPDVTGTLAKSASGAVEHVPLVREVNLSRALEQLKEAGFTCIGLDGDAKQTLSSLEPKGKIALVLGAEGSGLRRLVSENCDVLARLPTQGRIDSLNVSNAAAVALYEVAR